MKARRDRDAALREWQSIISNVFAGWDELDPPERRQRLAWAIAETGEFLKNLEDADAGRRFSEFALALRNLGQGSVSEILKFERKGRPKTTSEVWGVRAAASVAVDLLHFGGMALSDAAKEVARANRWLADFREKQGHGNAKLPAALVNWRERFLDTTVDDAFARAVWDRREEYRTEIASVRAVDRERRAKELGAFQLSVNKPQ